MPVARRNAAWLKRVLVSSLERLRSDDVARTPEVHATIAHVERALAELEVEHPDETIVKGALLAALEDLTPVSSARELCAALRTAAGHIYGVTF